MMDKFDKKIKEALENYEAPYDVSDWNALNNKIRSPKTNLFKWIGGAAAFFSLTFGAYYFINHTNNVELSEKNKVVTNETVVNHKTNTTNSLDKNESDENNISSHKEVNHSINEVHQDEIKQQYQKNDTKLNADSQNNQINVTDNVDQTEQLNQPERPEEIKSNNVNIDDLIVDFYVNNHTQCLGNEFVMSPKNRNQDVIYFWQMGDGSSQYNHGDMVTHSYNKPGVYEVYLTLLDAKTKKTLKQSEPQLVNVLEVPNTDFTYEHINSTKPITVFRNQTPNINSFQWVIENVANANTPEFEYSFINKGDYNVSLTTTMANGCSHIASKIISIENDYNLLAPSAFTPDGDNRNDFFIPKALTVLNLPFTMTVYDRQGNMLYQTNDFSKPWDGTFLNGMPAPSGIYVWVVQLTNDKGETEIYKDHVMLTK